MKDINNLITDNIKQELFSKANEGLIFCLDEEWSVESKVTINEVTITNSRISVILYDYNLKSPHFIVEINVKTPFDIYIYSVLFDLDLNFIDDMLR